MTFFNMLPKYQLDLSFDFIKGNDPQKLKAIMNYSIGIEKKYTKNINYLLELEVRFCHNQGSCNIINEIQANRSSSKKTLFF